MKGGERMLSKLIKSLLKAVSWPFRKIIDLTKKKKSRKTSLEADMDLLESKGYSLIVDIDGDYYKIKATKKGG